MFTIRCSVHFIVSNVYRLVYSGKNAGCMKRDAILFFATDTFPPPPIPICSYVHHRRCAGISQLLLNIAS